MGEPTYFIDDIAQTARAAEVPNADFAAGCNEAGSCAPGLGINMNEGAISGTPENFTLLDQFGNARAAQISQHIGGSGLDVGSVGLLPEAVARFGTNPADASGEITVIGNCTLTTLAGGWVIQV